MPRLKTSKVIVLLIPREFGRFKAYLEAQRLPKSTQIARLIHEHLDPNKFTLKLSLAYGYRYYRMPEGALNE